MTSHRGLGLAMVVGLSLAGCPRAEESPDAHWFPDVGTLPDGARPDAGHGTAPVLSPCPDSAYCADAPGVACLTNIPGGACTRRCSDDTECGAHGTCVQHICLWSCTSGLGDCVAHAGACIAGADGASYCSPICYPAGHEPPGYPACGSGLVCDPYTSTCVAELPTTGGDDGAACTDGIDCLGGQCLLETDFSTGEATGFLDGLCVSYGIVPPLSQYDTSVRLPQGSCPFGSAVMPVYASAGYSGDLALCWATCTSDASCRPGYACTHLESPAHAFTDGLCLPVDCTSAPCPTGSTCRTVSDPWLGHPVCGRP